MKRVAEFVKRPFQPRSMSICRQVSDEVWEPAAIMWRAVETRVDIIQNHLVDAIRNKFKRKRKQK